MPISRTRLFSRRVVLAAAAAAMLAGTAGVAAAAPASTAEPTKLGISDETHWVSLHSRLDYTAIGTHWVTAFSAVILEDYEPNSRFDWTSRPISRGSGFDLHNRQTGTCLEPASLFEDAVLHMPCNGSFKQAWVAIYPGGPDHNPAEPWIGFKNVWSGKALTVGVPGWAGTLLQQHTYADVQSQHFEVVPR